MNVNNQRGASYEEAPSNLLIEPQQMFYYFTSIFPYKVKLNSGKSSWCSSPLRNYKNKAFAVHSL